MTYTFLPEPNIIHIELLSVLSFFKGCVHLSFKTFFKNDLLSRKNYLLASPRNIGVHTFTPEYASTTNISTTPPSPQSWFSHIGVHNSIPEYVSTAGISIVMTMPFHVKPFQKKFLKKWLSPQISSKPPSPQEMEHRKKEREGKRKAPRVSSNKRGSRYLERRKTLQLQKSFLLGFHFLPLHNTIWKTLSKIIEKVFSALFGPSFSLAIYMTWVVPSLFTHELHLFSL
jgi:hypothetical protein